MTTNTIPVETPLGSKALTDVNAACEGFGVALASIPYSLRVLLENALRRGDIASAKRIANREAGSATTFLPARILVQDLLGVPVMVDLSSMRDAAAERGADPAKINPRLPVDVVIDHSIIPEFYGTPDARERNEQIEMERNAERFRFLRWCQDTYDNVRVVPPGKGIMHQINIEYLASVYHDDPDSGIAYPDSVYGTDSHTPMVNGVSVVGWGVGGLEAEMALLGRETAFPVPEVVGVRLSGNLRPGITATDLVLTITERLRKLGVVGKFVEFCGESLDALPTADRSTISNMAPEYGATCVYFPIDRQTIDYLRLSGRTAAHIEMVEACAKAQGLWREPNSAEPTFETLIELDLDDIAPSIAGPRRPQDRVPLAKAHKNLTSEFDLGDPGPRYAVAGEDFDLGDGDVVIAAITSCTNTSNPAVVIGAALLARNALEKGLKTKPWVKTTFSPGSQVVADYLNAAGLQTYLDQLGFNVVGFGCATCNGGSGPLNVPIRDAILENDLTCAAALSGNRNFEGRIHPHCRANYIMSPPLVVAYALAGTMFTDLADGVIGQGSDGSDIKLSDIWPSDHEIAEVIGTALRSDMFSASYAEILNGSDGWKALGDIDAKTYAWDNMSTYLRCAPYVDGIEATPAPLLDLRGLRPLVMLGDSVTTDHISPSGTILAESAAGKYLMDRDVTERDFNMYGTRRGNHEVVMRSTFANNRLHNEIIPDSEGSVTKLMPEGTEMSVFDAAMAYQERGTGLIVVAGKEYGCGSSRDAAAKCVKLLGVKAVLAESYERIHRSNLVGMGILPLQFQNGETRQSLELTGAETFDVVGIENGLGALCDLTLVITYADGRKHETTVLARLDTPSDATYVESGGVMPFVFRDMVYGSDAA